MKDSIIRFGSWLRGLNTITFILVCSGIMMAFNFTSSLIFELLSIELDPDNILDFRKNTMDLALMAVFIAPLSETFIFQAIIFWAMRKVNWLNRHKGYIMVVGGVIFGAVHSYSLAYVGTTSIMGILLMFFYISRFRKNAYWCVVAIHAIVNTIAFAVNYFAEN